MGIVLALNKASSLRDGQTSACGCVQWSRKAHDRETIRERATCQIGGSSEQAFGRDTFGIDDFMSGQQDVVVTDAPTALHHPDAGKVCQATGGDKQVACDKNPVLW